MRTVQVAATGFQQILPLAHKPPIIHNQLDSLHRIPAVFLLQLRQIKLLQTSPYQIYWFLLVNGVILEVLFVLVVDAQKSTVSEEQAWTVGVVRRSCGV
jgi:hypothetical protein